MADRAGGGANTDPGVDAGDQPALRKAAGDWLRGIRGRDYLCPQAYLGPGTCVEGGLDLIRRTLLTMAGRPVTLGRGPRFLHSTGQLHKGGPDEACVLQIVDRPAADLAVPETDFTFGRLVRAQADGDLAALRQRGRRVLRVDLGGDVAGGLARLAAALDVTCPKSAR
jgi:transaldolase/glucose-6-phosphate isomerase